MQGTARSVIMAAMASLSHQADFAAAERAYLEGRLQDARARLLTLERAAPPHPAIHRLRGLVESGLGDEEAALASYERALALAPDFRDAALNRAISLYRVRSQREGLAALRLLISRNPADGALWNVLGYLELDIRDVSAAAAAFDQALSLRPDDPMALKGRASVARDRGESDVLDRYAAARAALPQDPQLILEQAQAKIAEGDDDAIDAYAQILERMPEWTEGQIELARMKLETRQDEGFADHIHLLLRREPARPELWRQYIRFLSDCARFEAAAEAACEARAVCADDDEFALLEAVHAGRAGDVARASALFAAIPPDVPGRRLHENAHLVRQGRLDLAKTSIEAALVEDPSDIGSWALAELVYRKLGDERSAWLSCQPGLVSTSDLPLDPGRFEAVKTVLLRLHRSAVQMVGQSVRAGTQTRGFLFDRSESELVELRQALEAALADYRAGLPAADDRHPLLRHRNAPLAIQGNWSIRLAGSGHHVSHIHPQGLISSACYFIVPDRAASSLEGRLEIGRPSMDLMLDLEPLHVIAPRVGQLVLFPSYFYHGTTPFAVGERLTVAFDVNRDLTRPG